MLILRKIAILVFQYVAARLGAKTTTRQLTTKTSFQIHMEISEFSVGYN